MDNFFEVLLIFLDGKQGDRTKKNLLQNLKYYVNKRTENNHNLYFTLLKDPNQNPNP